MAEKKSKLLSMCCICKAIKIDENTWLRKEQNPELYRRSIEPYKKLVEKGIPVISHGICDDEGCYNKFIGKEK